MNKEAKDNLKCQKNITNALSSSKRIQLLLKSLSEIGCSMKRSDICCEQCEDSLLMGGYEQSTKQVIICSNTCQSPKKVEEILAHELIHYYDDCTVQGMDFSNEKQLACSEIRAANLISCPQTLFHFAYISHESCVRTKASESVALIKSVSMKKANEIIDSVFKECINDGQPLDKNIKPTFFTRINENI